MEQLSQNIASQIIEIIFNSERWTVSPLDDGSFQTKKEALEWVKNNPGERIKIWVPVTYENNCAEGLVVHEWDDVILIEEDANMCHHTTYVETDNLNQETLATKVTKLLKDIMDECAYDAVPY